MNALPRSPVVQSPLRITAHSVACAAGVGVAALQDSLRERRGGLRPNDFTDVALPTYIGRVPGIEGLALPGRLAHWDCRNNRLAWLALQADDFFRHACAARDRYGADRVALVLGTSTPASGRPRRPIGGCCRTASIPRTCAGR